MRPQTKWDKLYFALVAQLANARSDEAPEGLCHLAAEITDAAMRERDIRFDPSLARQRLGNRHRPNRKPTEEETIALRRRQMGLPEKRATLDDIKGGDHE